MADPRERGLTRVPVCDAAFGRTGAAGVGAATGGAAVSPLSPLLQKTAAKNKLRLNPFRSEDLIGAVYVSFRRGLSR